MAPLDGRWAPSRYHKELQRAIAFRSYISILRSGVRKKQTQESILERLYHKGETNEHGTLIQDALVDQAVLGKGPFAALCDRHSYISIDGGTGERNEEVRLVVQDCFTRTLSVRFVIGESFTRESLSLAKLSDNKKLVSGRTLRAGAELAHRNGKKAYEFALDFLDENLELPANKTMDDYDTYILTMMWKDQKQQQMQQQGGVAAVDESQIAVRPTDWIFDGWFAFRLYGPVVDESMMEYKTDAFADPPDVLDDPDDEVAAMVVKAEAGAAGGGSNDPHSPHHPFTMPTPSTAAAAAMMANPRKRLARSSSYATPYGPFASHVCEEDRRHALDLAAQRLQARTQLGQAELESLRQKALSLQKQMELELKIALAVASDNAGHESWREYRVLQRQLQDVWVLVEAKHAQLHTEFVMDRESDMLSDYLASVTTKKYRFDTPAPPPPPHHHHVHHAQPPQQHSYHPQHLKSPLPPQNNTAAVAVQGASNAAPASAAAPTQAQAI